MEYCAKCGRRMDSKYCPKDGWTGTSQTDNRRIMKSRDNFGSPATAGDNSPIFMGRSDEVAPATSRTKERRLIRSFWVKILGLLGVLGSLASITGFTLGNIHLLGLASYYINLFPLGNAGNSSSKGGAGSASVTDVPIQSTVALPPGFGLFLISILILSCSVSLIVSLHFRKYRFWSRGRILEARAGWLRTSTIIGWCPRDGGRLKLKRVVIGSKTVKNKDMNGNAVQTEKDIKELRLVCENNGFDHRYMFDPTMISPQQFRTD